jgi:hypothetical protein
MPAHGASKDTRERAYLAGIHVVLRLKKMPAGTNPAMTPRASSLV